MLSPESPVLRSLASVRATTDGDDHPRSVEQLVCGLRDRLGAFRLYLWRDEWDGRQPDGFRAARQIFGYAQGLNPFAATMLGWAVDCAQVNRGKVMDEAVAGVCAARRDELIAFVEAIVERWPGDLDPYALAGHIPPPRTVRPPSSGAPRYPHASLALDDAPANIDAVLDRVTFELWRAGASDAELEAFNRELKQADRALGGVIARWMSVTGASSPEHAEHRLRERLFPLHPLNALLGVNGPLTYPLVAIISEPDLRALEEKTDRRTSCTVRRRDGAESLTSAFRSALRMGMDELLVNAAELTDAEFDLMVMTLDAGMALVVGGRNAVVERVLAAARERELPVFETVR
ncbi:MAG: hypothetical protein ACK4N5_16525 [Myxococcales bacterium]